MATVNLGSIKFKWKGTYSGATAYTVDDVVSYNGSSYICILASTGNLPTNATYFEQMSQAGTNGTDLTTTLTTQGDLVYRDGSGLQRLGAGTNGQFLQTNGSGANPTWGTVASKVLSISNYENATRTSLPGSTAHTYWSGNNTISKANSDLIISVTLQYHNSASGNVGHTFYFNGTAYNDRIGHIYTGQPHQHVTCASFYIPNASTTTGSKAWSIQFYSIGSAGQPASIWNPNGSDDSRIGQTVSSLIIMEIDN